MARAVQEIWPDVKVTIGPVIENGWYYDFDRAEPFTPEDLGAIEARMREIIDRPRPGDAPRSGTATGRSATTRRTHEPYKVELVEAIPGDRADPDVLARPLAGPLPRPAPPNTGQVAARRLQADVVAGRLLARRFEPPDAPAHLRRGLPQPRGPEGPPHQLEEAAKRDHRRLGKEMDLFHFQEEAPGMVFWHPNGWTIYRALEDYMRRRLSAAGYKEIRTPQVVDRKLWEASGHWDKYRENMFITEIDEEHANEKRVNMRSSR